MTGMLDPVSQEKDSKNVTVGILFLGHIWMPFDQLLLRFGALGSILSLVHGKDSTWAEPGVSSLKTSDFFAESL